MLFLQWFSANFVGIIWCSAFMLYIVCQFVAPFLLKLLLSKLKTQDKIVKSRAAQHLHYYYFILFLIKRDE